MRAQQAATLVAIWLAVPWLFLAGIHGPLLLDDRSVLSPIESGVANGEALQALWSRAGHLGRPVSTLSFIAEFSLFGVSTATTKAIGVLVHLLNGLLVSWLAIRLLQLGGVRQPQVGWWLGLFWMLLPSQVGTVLYATQRMTLLATLFVLLGLNLALRVGDVRARGLRWACLGGFLACLLLACLAKETGVLLLPLAALLLCFPLPGRSRNDHAPWLGRLLAGISLVAGAGFLLWCFVWLPVQREAIFSARGWTPGLRLLTEVQVLWLYAAQTLLPLPHLLPFHHDHWVASESLLDGPWPLAAIGGWLLLVAMLLRHRQGLPLAGLGVLFFLVGHSLEASPYPLELVFEHRNYLPSFGLVLALAACLQALPLRAPLQTAVASLCTLVFAFACHARVLQWSDEHRLAVHHFELNPASPRAASHLAALLTTEGAFAEAVNVLGTQTHPGAALQQLHILCRHADLDADAFSSLLPEAHAARLDGYAATAAIQVSDVLHEGRCRTAQPRFVTWLRTAIEEGHFVHEAERLKLSIHVAHGLADIGEEAAALAWVEAEATRHPQPLPLLMAAEWRSRGGDCALARQHLEQAESAARRDRDTDWSDLLQQTATLLVERGCSGPSAIVSRSQAEQGRSP